MFFIAFLYIACITFWCMIYFPVYLLLSVSYSVTSIRVGTLLTDVSTKPRKIPHSKWNLCKYWLNKWMEDFACNCIKNQKKLSNYKLFFLTPHSKPQPISTTTKLAMNMFTAIPSKSLAVRKCVCVHVCIEREVGGNEGRSVFSVTSLLNSAKLTCPELRWRESSCFQPAHTCQAVLAILQFAQQVWKMVG